MVLPPTAGACTKKRHIVMMTPPGSNPLGTAKAESEAIYHEYALLDKLNMDDSDEYD